MSRFRTHLLFAAFLFIAGSAAVPLFAGPATAQPAAAQTGAPEFAEVREKIAGRFAGGGAPGLVVALARGGELVFEAGFGVRDTETGRPVRPDMAFRNGSTTKMMLAAALVDLLAEKGLGLNAPIGSYVDGLDPAIGRLSAHQLLTHTSGLADKADDFGLHDESALGINVESKNSGDFFADPGAVYSYSNPGYDVAGHVFAALAGGNFADAFRDRLLRPAGMARSMFRATHAMTYPFALPHRRGEDGDFHVIRPMPDNAAEWPSGLMYTTAGDLARFAVLLMQGGVGAAGERVVAARTVDKIATPHVAVPGAEPARSYGYGLGIFEAAGEPVWQHGGAIAGFVTAVTMLPERNLAVTAMVNAADGALVADVTDLLLDETAGITLETPEPELSPVPDDIAQRLAGRYGQFDVQLTLGFDDGALVGLDGEGEAIGPVRMVHGERFALEDGDGTPYIFAVTWAPDGSVRYIHAGSRALVRIAD